MAPTPPTGAALRTDGDGVHLEAHLREGEPGDAEEGLDGRLAGPAAGDGGAEDGELLPRVVDDVCAVGSCSSAGLVIIGRTLSLVLDIEYLEYSITPRSSRGGEPSGDQLD
jgi:hypothetical protein